MSILDAIRRAEQDNGVIDPNEYSPIYQEVLRGSSSSNPNAPLVSQAAFRALMQGHFRTDNDQQNFYHGLLEQFKQRKINEICEALGRFSISERAELLRYFSEPDSQGNVYPILYHRSNLESPLPSGDYTGIGTALTYAIAMFTAPIWIPLVFVGQPVGTAVAIHSEAQSGMTPLGNFVNEIFGNSRSYFLSGSLYISDGIDNLPLQESDLEEARNRLPHTTSINFVEIRRLILDSLRGQRVSSNRVSTDIQAGGGVLGGTGYTTGSAGVRLDLGRDMAVTERGPLIHQFYFRGGARIFSFNRPLPSMNSTELVVPEWGLGYSFTRQSRTRMYPAWSLSAGVETQIFPQVDPLAVNVVVEGNIRLRVYSSFFLEGSGGGSYSPTLGLGWHAGAGLGFYL